MIRYCRARLGSGDARHSADDVAQDVLLAVFAALPRYDGPTQGLRAFVFGIAALVPTCLDRQCTHRDSAELCHAKPGNVSDLRWNWPVGGRASAERRASRVLHEMTRTEIRGEARLAS